MPVTSYPQKTISYIKGLAAALALKLETSLLKTDLTSNSDSFIASVKAIVSALALKVNIPVAYTLTNSLAGDYSTGTHVVATLSDGAGKTISIANLTALRVHTYKIKNTHASASVTVTLPTAAGHNRSNATFTIPAGYRRAVEVLYDGAEYWWTVGRLKTVTV